MEEKIFFEGVKRFSKLVRCNFVVKVEKADTRKLIFFLYVILIKAVLVHIHIMISVSVHNGMFFIGGGAISI